MDFIDESNIQGMEFDEIDRQISKRNWQCFQHEMENLEYKRRNLDLQQRIKMLKLQLNTPHVLVPNEITSIVSPITAEQFDYRMRSAFELNQLRSEKIEMLETNYQQKVNEIETSCNDMVAMFENLSTVKKKRTLENELTTVQHTIAKLDTCIAEAKQKLRDTHTNREYFISAFVLQSVRHWKTCTTLNEQFEMYRTRLNELNVEIELTRNEVAIQEKRAVELQKETDLRASQTPRFIAKLPIAYTLLEENGVIDSPASISPSNSIPEEKRVHVIEDIVVKPANMALGASFHANEMTDQLIKSKKLERLTKRCNSDDGDSKGMASTGNSSSQKKPKITPNQPMITHADPMMIAVGEPGPSQRTLRSLSRKLSESTTLSQSKVTLSGRSIQQDEFKQPSQSTKMDIDAKALEKRPSKLSSPIIAIAEADENMSFVSSFQPNFDSFLNMSDHESHHTENDDSKEDNFFTTNEGDVFDFFQANPNENDQLFM